MLSPLTEISNYIQIARISQWNKNTLCYVLDLLNSSQPQYVKTYAGTASSKQTQHLIFGTAEKATTLEKHEPERYSLPPLIQHGSRQRTETRPNNTRMVLVKPFYMNLFLIITHFLYHNTQQYDQIGMLVTLLADYWLLWTSCESWMTTKVLENCQLKVDTA